MHHRFMELAIEEGEKALASSEFPVGCVITDGERVITKAHRMNSKVDNELDHAEMVALRSVFSGQREHDGMSLSVYSTMEPCLMCYSTLVLHNVSTIVYGFEDAMGGGTSLDLSTLKPLYAHREIDIIPHILRRECLQLFKKFFSDQKNGYLQNSLLARYTMEQKL